MADLKACNEIEDSLYSEIHTHLLIERDDQRYMQASDEQIKLYASQINEYKTIQDLADKQLKKAKRNGKLLQGSLYFAGAVIVCETGYIGVQLLKK